MDEGSVTVTQMQALRAAKNAGIVVPKSIIDKAVKYLENSTTESGGVIYSLAQSGGRAVGGGQPALTAAALACGQSAGEYCDPDQTLAQVLSGAYSDWQRASLWA